MTSKRGLLALLLLIGVTTGPVVFNSDLFVPERSDEDGVARYDVEGLRLGTTMEQVSRRLKCRPNYGEVPILFYPAKEGGFYMLSFFDWSKPESFPGADQLSFAVYFPSRLSPDGAECVLPIASRRKVFRWPPKPE